MKVVCTVGNNLKDLDTLDKFIKAGTDVFRFNFSHINYEKSDLFISFLKINYPNLLVMADLQGNKIRISSKLTTEMKILQGEQVCFYKEELYPINVESYICIPLTFKGNLSFLNLNGRLLLNGGDTVLKIDSMDDEGEKIYCTVIDGGLLLAGKSINTPSIIRKDCSLTPKDLEDLIWAIKRKVDIIVLPYILSDKEIVTVRKILFAYLEDGRIETIPLIYGKIESQIDDKSLENIITEADGIVIGRGDLSNEVPIIAIPKIQEQIISMCKASEKPILFSNHILNSMVCKKNPNINEVSELYSLIKAGVDGVILCDEITRGSYPMNTLRFLKSFIDFYTSE